jgi:hypothetical protein
MLLTNSLARLKAWRVRFGLLGALISLLVGCEKVGSTDEKNPVPKDAVRLLFTYSSEKEDWVTDVTATFNHGGYKTKAGKQIYVDAIPEGSGECVDKIINDTQKADLVSPASEVFVRLGNTQGRAKLGREVIGPTQNLVVLPVVIGIWEPMARALGWPHKPIGWSDVLGLATDNQGWVTYGYPESSWRGAALPCAWRRDDICSMACLAETGEKQEAPGNCPVQRFDPVPLSGRSIEQPYAGSFAGAACLTFPSRKT